MIVSDQSKKEVVKKPHSGYTETGVSEYSHISEPHSGSTFKGGVSITATRLFIREISYQPQHRCRFASSSQWPILSCRFAAYVFLTFQPGFNIDPRNPDQCKRIVVKIGA